MLDSDGDPPQNCKNLDLKIQYNISHLTLTMAPLDSFKWGMHIFDNWTTLKMKYKIVIRNFQMFHDFHELNQKFRLFDWLMFLAFWTNKPAQIDIHRVIKYFHTSIDGITVLRHYTRVVYKNVQLAKSVKNYFDWLFHETLPFNSLLDQVCLNFLVSHITEHHVKRFSGGASLNIWN